jgi:anti-sigma regulatory factor (Ser/Thr protein kinase)
MAELPPLPDLKLEMFSQPRLLAAARAMVGNLAQRLGFNEIQCGQISLAIDEALCNIINHGYERRPDGRIWLNVWDLHTDPPGIRVVIEDRAKQVDPDKIRPRDLDDIRPGGLGVYIIREIMDDVAYERRHGGGMRLTMTKRMPVADRNTATDESRSLR